jgi:hypothetical protein
MKLASQGKHQSRSRYSINHQNQQKDHRPHSLFLHQSLCKYGVIIFT